LWLSRDPAHGRGLINRQIIERRLRDLGWTIVTFELMPVRAQLDALARAEVVAGEEALTFHNLLLLKDIGGKRFHVFRRHGPEHLSFRTIGDARGVNQQFHSCSQDAMISVSGRAVVRLAPEPGTVHESLGDAHPQGTNIPVGLEAGAHYPPPEPAGPHHRRRDLAAAWLSQPRGLHSGRGRKSRHCR
jgi:hypothetical protein